MNDRQQYQIQGMQWLYEMEVLNHPQLVNNLKMNIMVVSDKIKEVELLISRPHKSIMIWIDVDLGWFRKEVKFNRIQADILDIMEQLLPSYRFRVVHDKAIMELAITRLEESLKGVEDEVSNTNDDNVTDDSAGEDGLQEASDILPDQEEQSENESEESAETIESDISNSEET